MKPDATASQVREAFQRRVRDVHPDTGGTGDGLTMRLLIEARDEAMGAIEERRQAAVAAYRDGDVVNSKPQPRRRGSSRQADEERVPWQQAPKVRSHPCYCCGQPYPRDQLGYNRIWRGYRGRSKNGNVLMCGSCSSQADEHWRREAAAQRTVAIIGLVIMGLLTFLFAVLDFRK